VLYDNIVRVKLVAVSMISVMIKSK